MRRRYASSLAFPVMALTSLCYPEQLKVESKSGMRLTLRVLFEIRAYMVIRENDTDGIEK